MYWYAIYRYIGVKRPGISGPFTSEDKAWYALSRIQERDSNVLPWDVHGTFISEPEGALLEFLGEREAAYIGGLQEDNRID